MPLPSPTRLGTVRLRVKDLDRTRDFYERAIGLQTLETDASRARLGADDQPLVELLSAPTAPPRPPASTGLFHLAILLPSRPALGDALERLLAAGALLSGASDHLVSEALYLTDPEGNGIELYRDRPREQWPTSQGEIQMATLPLDLGSLETSGRADAGAPHGTTIGHVHLQVSDLAAAERFYVGEVGFEPTVRSYPGALFMSAGGYHHHIGLNTWHSAGAPPPPPGALGLADFDVLVPGLTAERRLTDPAGIELVLRPR